MKRYDECCCASEKADGRFVEYEDHVAALTAAERAHEATKAEAQKQRRERENMWRRRYAEESVSPYDLNALAEQRAADPKGRKGYDY